MEKIYVTKTFLPPLAEYNKLLERVWTSGQVTNQGPLLLEFESKTKEYLGVSSFHFVQNGTLALQLALRALGADNGEVITTPFSYVATTSAILWESSTPVFVDINPNTLCIDEDKIEASITKRTKAILAVHVFGRPCNTEKIEIIAKKHKLKVIYDGAHAFGADYKGKSLLDYGDVSICSFHATKLFHTIEGGAIIAKNKEVSEKIELMKRFGHNVDEHIMLGINAKASELQAAMGLCNLGYLDEIIEKRKQLYEIYDQFLEKDYKAQASYSREGHNYAYYPVLFKNEKKLLKTVSNLEAEKIYARRYFWPALNTLEYLKGTKQHCPVAEDIASRVLCLPLYADLKSDDVKKICKIIMS